MKIQKLTLLDILVLILFKIFAAASIIINLENRHVIFHRLQHFFIYLVELLTIPFSNKKVILKRIKKYVTKCC